MRLTADLSTETLQARREWPHILKVRKEKHLQPWLLYPARIERATGRKGRGPQMEEIG